MRFAPRPVSPRRRSPSAPTTWPLDEFMPTLADARRKQFGRGTLGLYVGAAIRQGKPCSTTWPARAPTCARRSARSRATSVSLAATSSGCSARDEPDGLTMFEEHPIPRASRRSAAATRVRRRDLLRAASTNGSTGGRAKSWFSHAPLGPIDDYQQVLGCPVLFERELVGLRFDDERSRRRRAATIRSSFASSSRTLSAFSPRRRPPRRSASGSVTRSSSGCARESRASPSIAEALATSERSLQRKLQTEGVSFRDVVDEARHKLAVRLPRRPDPLVDRRRLPARVFGGGGVHARLQALDGTRAQPGPWLGPLSLPQKYERIFNRMRPIDVDLASQRCREINATLSRPQWDALRRHVPDASVRPPGAAPLTVRLRQPAPRPPPSSVIPLSFGTRT